MIQIEIILEIAVGVGGSVLIFVRLLKKWLF
jgi:hypothetical protein